MLAGLRGRTYRCWFIGWSKDWSSIWGPGFYDSMTYGWDRENRRNEAHPIRIPLSTCLIIDEMKYKDYSVLLTRASVYAKVC